jgi:hypothetical protein
MSTFRTVLPPYNAGFSINYSDTIFATGSCFAENIGRKLEAYRWNVLINPFGIIYHPLPLAAMFDRIIEERPFVEEDIFKNAGLWHSWMHHGRLSHPDKTLMLEGINASLSAAHEHLKSARVLLLTFGTSNGFYHRQSGEVVANCHKMPGDLFQKKRTGVSDLINQMEACLEKILVFNPTLQVIVTVSPVRHLRDGLVANNRSKAGLLLVAEHLEATFEQVHYFPGYELLIDDLRDYRFYAEDMSHPSAQATEYIWDVFTNAFLSKESKQYLSEAGKLLKALAHRPMYPGSESDTVFQKKLKQDLADFCAKWGVDLTGQQPLH